MRKIMVVALCFGIGAGTYRLGYHSGHEDGYETGYHVAYAHADAIAEDIISGYRRVQAIREASEYRRGLEARYGK